MNQLEEFKALGLSDDILTAIAKKGFETPSAIQSLTIPHLLTTDKDIIAQAQTGTGKTAAFGLPIIQMLTSRRNIPQAIVLVPTRELALQVTQELISFNTHDLSIAPIYGGASMTEQLRRLKKGIDIVVGTPGRILDHIRRGTLDLSAIAYLVLDEADEMLNMGFIEDIEEIMHAMTGPKRVLLFSATMPDRIAALARNYMHEPDLLKVESQHVTTDLTSNLSSTASSSPAPERARTISWPNSWNAAMRPKSFTATFRRPSARRSWANSRKNRSISWWLRTWRPGAST